MVGRGPGALRPPLQPPMGALSKRTYCCRHWSALWPASFVQAKRAGLVLVSSARCGEVQRPPGQAIGPALTETLHRAIHLTRLSLVWRRYCSAEQISARGGCDVYRNILCRKARNCVFVLSNSALVGNSTGSTLRAQQPRSARQCTALHCTCAAGRSHDLLRK